MYEKEIRQGIAWLMANHPDRDLNKVNLDELALEDWGHCILGQLLGERNCYRMIISDMIWAISHGFTLDVFAEDYQWERLTDEWVDILRARRAARNFESKDGQ